MRTLGSVYRNSGNDRYLRLLMSLFMLVEENGDGTAQEGSVFMNAVMQLRMEARDERRFAVSRRHKFMGLTLTAALPVATAMFIAAWGVNTNPSLLEFYYGRAGTVFRIAILMLSLFCYRIVADLRDPEGFSGTRFRESLPDFGIHVTDRLRKPLKKAVIFSVSGMIMMASLMMSHNRMKELLKNDVSNINMICDVADGRQIAAMEYFIPVYTQMYAEGSVPLPSKDELTEMLLGENGIRSAEVAWITAEEILRRIGVIQAETADALDMIIAIVAGIVGVFYPKFEETVGKLMLESRIKDEIMQFQTIIGMQKDVPGISPLIIMESLENFSSYFSEPLKKCLNEYGINEQEALTELKLSSNDPDFERIADCFIMADELGVKDAFDEITSEIRAFREDRRTEKVIRMDNDVLLGSLTAVLPGGLILFGYLLIPFMISALNMFNSYQNSLTDYISIT
ncbi:MAG: hypothetical protein J6Y89_05970 [Lachnospiraceae bacterium]|nr:hypothetical protein [Lachnospiraceae bacterium]